MIKVLLVDDHQLIRAGIRYIIDAAGDMQVVAEAASGEEAMRLAGKVAPDIVLMDIRFPNGMNGIETTRRMVRMNEDLKIMALTVYDEDPFPAQAREAGAVGYLTKGCPARELLDAIRKVNRGEPYIDSDVARRHMLADGWGRDQAADSPFKDLSAREMQVAMMFLEGLRANEIADMLSLSVKTVSTYKTRVFEKLGIRTEVELARLAMHHGLIT